MADAKKQKVTPEIETKYIQDMNGKFLREAKANPKDRIEVEIGDTKQTDLSAD